jgi:hypothetical protein
MEPRSDEKLSDSMPGVLLEAMVAVLLIAGSLALNNASANSVQSLISITGFKASELQGHLWTCME